MNKSKNLNKLETSMFQKEKILNSMRKAALMDFDSNRDRFFHIIELIYIMAHLNNKKCQKPHQEIFKQVEKIYIMHLDFLNGSQKTVIRKKELKNSNSQIA